MALKAFSSSLLFFSIAKPASTQDVPFSPCPLLGPRFPVPTKLATSPIFQSGLHNLTQVLDDYVTNLNGTFGPISSSTSFSITLFSTEETNSSQPFLYEYHHTAPGTLGTPKADANSVYEIGDLTTLFTTWLFLIEAGEHHWTDPVSRWVPELVDSAQNKGSGFAVDWDAVTLGDLAGHLGGIGWYAPSDNSSDIASLLGDLTYKNDTDVSPCASREGICDRTEFLAYFGSRDAIFTPGSTPIFSNAAFIILAYALESIAGQPYATLLERSILRPLNLTQTSYLPSTVEAPFNGLASTPHDLTTALTHLLRSTLLPHPTTRRWLKPTSHTSNLVNAVGRPWEIYSLSATPISPVIPVYQVRGNAGVSASHTGLVPDYGAGFVILATDATAGSPDLNAHADILASGIVPVLERTAIAQAAAAFAGTYVSASRENTTLVVALAGDGSPGLSVLKFLSGGRDVRAGYAALNGIAPDDLSFRLYPSDAGRRGVREVFRASFQDSAALGDAGTPTCETWRGVNRLQVGGRGLDEFVFGMEGGVAVDVVVPAFGAGRLERKRGV
ncbi:beta-lactamase/transpeptidase-like protein [Karstenula rhodostoma CBS 690.94]|uniref:Beta-lactamase/transpeptidase-like protein n=1 Tax=Karstenula rhodostoma CBS 690.94 TaxID=1392251 RepID=A0A9P4UGX9_9PLEO|nr:beta-lactamase/transpeptidase-like protein [Karstenula rhodostoma CBS 690.94]